ncbi:hypothetical protein MNBD_GAMMA22-2332 [hydrothermal vent metagenome]|uniref:MSHA biogenesis protein MshO n=1 Tax=hydrothermal vent metagenome TaxID=652676 RepID=A0A3B0ZK63_9ZZZZ
MARFIKQVHKKSKAFTLVELTIVIILVAIIAAVSSQFFTNVVLGYNDADLRVALSHSGRIATEKVSRELRNAMPQSIRVSNNCIEFIPISSSAHYQDQNLTYTSPAVASKPLPVSGQNSADNQLDVFNLNFTAQAGMNYYVVVYPLGPGSLNADPYITTNPGSLFNYVSQSFINAPSNSITRITMDAAYLFTRHSPMRRLFIVTAPISYCIVANRLQRHTSYGFNSTQASPPLGTIQRVVDDLQLNDSGNPIIPFVFTAGTLVRNAVVKLDFRIRKIDQLGNDNWVRLSHEVQIRNVP